MPYYFYVDDDGDQTALPCTERLMNERTAARVSTERCIALLSIKGRPEVRLGSFTSLAGGPLVGRWTPPSAKPEPMPEAETKHKKKPKKPAEEAPETEATSEGDEPPAETQAADAEASGDGDLENLLASLKDEGETPPAESAEGEEPAMDPELAALLKGM